MILIGMFLMSAAFYLLYSCSKRAVYKRGKMNHWLLEHSVFLKFSSLVLLLLSFSMFVFQIGFGAGVFFALVSMMTILALLVVLYPLLVK